MAHAAARCCCPAAARLLTAASIPACAAEAEAAEAAVRAATEGGALGDEMGLGGEVVGAVDGPGAGGVSAEQAALAESGGTMGATHVWQG